MHKEVTYAWMNVVYKECILYAFFFESLTVWFIIYWTENFLIVYMSYILYRIHRRYMYIVIYFILAFKIICDLYVPITILYSTCIETGKYFDISKWNLYHDFLCKIDRFCKYLQGIKNVELCFISSRYKEKKMFERKTLMLLKKMVWINVWLNKKKSVYANMISSISVIVAFVRCAHAIDELA